MISSPGGATATIDARRIPPARRHASLDATPGRHTIVINMAGYQWSAAKSMWGLAQEMPAMVMRRSGGSLMADQRPSGATVSINGKKMSQLTPAQIPLAPGTYKITVEKDGQQAARTVDVRSGISYLKVLFDQQ